MSDETDGAPTPAEMEQQRRQELKSCAVGAGLALSLTLLPFAAVHWHATSHFGLLALVGTCGLLQILVHFRFFLHIGFGQQREDLQLILFSALLLFIMVAGTLWIMGNLSQRMGMPGAS